MMRRGRVRVSVRQVAWSWLSVHQGGKAGEKRCAFHMVSLDGYQDENERGVDARQLCHGVVEKISFGSVRQDLHIRAGYGV